MPYILPEQRKSIECENLLDAGELNYAITMLLVCYWETHGKNYQTINDILGALEGAKAEFYRRVAAPYEDQKIAENGDVY